MSEASEQKEIVSWFRAAYPKYSSSFSLSMNGAYRGKGKKGAIRTNALKAQGMVPGECDFKVLVPRGTFHGLCIEFKIKGGRATQEQLNYLEYMDSLGYLTALCIGKEAAIETIKSYLDRHCGLGDSH